MLRAVSSLNLSKDAVKAGHSKTVLSIRLTHPFVMNWDSLWALTLKRCLLKEVADHQLQLLWPNTLLMATGSWINQEGWDRNADGHKARHKQCQWRTSKVYNTSLLGTIS